MRVELFDGNLLDRSAAEMRRMLADNGLELVATYAGGNFIFDDILPEELARVTRAADRAAELGAPRIWWWAAGPSGSTARASRTITSWAQRSTE